MVTLGVGVVEGGSGEALWTPASLLGGARHLGERRSLWGLQPTDEVSVAAVRVEPAKAAAIEAQRAGVFGVRHGRRVGPWDPRVGGGGGGSWTEVGSQKY